MKGSLEIVRVLIAELNATVDAQDINGQTPLMLACLSEHHSVALAMIQEYQCPLTTRDLQGHTVLHYECAKCDMNVLGSALAEMKTYMSEQTGMKLSSTDVAVLHEMLVLISDKEKN